MNRILNTPSMLNMSSCSYSLIIAMGLSYFYACDRVKNEDNSIVWTIERYRYDRVHDVINGSPQSGDNPERNAALSLVRRYHPEPLIGQRRRVISIFC